MDEDEDIGGLATGEGIAGLMTPGLTVPMALQGVQKAEGVQRQQMQANLDLLNAARAELRSKRVGPSDAEKWFAIASALGQPTRTGSFGETVGNLGTLLSKYSGEKRTAEEERALKERELEMKAGMGQLQLLQGDTQSARELFSTVSRNEAAQTAAAKASQPSYAYDQLGILREVPARGTVHYPRTEEEFNRLPVGAYYRVPSGPEAGKIIPKRG